MKKLLSNLSRTFKNYSNQQNKSFTTQSHGHLISYYKTPSHNFTSRSCFSQIPHSCSFVSRKGQIFTNSTGLKQILGNTQYFRVHGKGGIGANSSRGVWSMKSFQFGGQHYRLYHSQYNSFRSNWRSWLQRLSSSDVVLGLIVTNVAVFMLWRIADHGFMMRNFTLSLDNFKSGRVHTMITSAFSHTDTGHIIANMIGLYFFGTSIGRSFGSEYLLKLYLAGAIGGSVCYLIYHTYLAQKSKGGGFRVDPSKIPVLGASGAVDAIMLLDIFLFPKATLYFYLVVPVPAFLLGIFIIGKDMLHIIEGGGQTAGSAHLGGALVAAIAWARIRRGIF